MDQQPYEDPMNTGSQLTRRVRAAGFVAMIVGAVDPLEGSVLILIGGGLVALGAFLARDERRLVVYWAVVFALIVVGVAAMWGLTAVGGIGGSSGRSMWWSVLLLPYLAGWMLATWGRGSPRWFSWLAMAVGLWYLAILAMIVLRGPARHGPGLAAPLVLAAVGLVTIAGSAVRLRRAHAATGIRQRDPRSVDPAPGGRRAERPR
jgi:hypothetical protein